MTPVPPARSHYEIKILLRIRISLGLEFQAKLFETKIDTRIDLKTGSECQNFWNIILYPALHSLSTTIGIVGYKIPRISYLLAQQTPHISYLLAQQTPPYFL